MKRARWLKIGVHKKFSNFGSQGRRRERAEAKGRGREEERERKRIDGAMEGRARSYVGSTPRLRATRIHEWDETRSNNLIYEYFAATRIVRASFEYSGIVLLVAYGNIRARPQYLNNARKLLLLVPYFCYSTAAAKTVSSEGGINRMDLLGGKICMEMGMERPISGPRAYDS